MNQLSTVALSIAACFLATDCTSESCENRCGPTSNGNGHETVHTIRSSPEVDDGTFFFRSAGVPYGTAWAFYDHRAISQYDYETLVSVRHPAIDDAVGFTTLAVATPATQQPWSIEWLGQIPHPPEWDPLNSMSREAVRQWTWTHFMDAIPVADPGQLDVRVVQRWEYFPNSDPPPFVPPSGFEVARGVLGIATGHSYGTVYAVRRASDDEVLALVWATPRCGFEIWAFRSGLFPPVWENIGEDYPGATVRFEEHAQGPQLGVSFPCDASETFTTWLLGQASPPLVSWVLVEHRYYVAVADESPIACDPPPDTRTCSDPLRAPFPGPVWIAARDDQQVHEFSEILAAEARRLRGFGIAAPDPPYDTERVGSTTWIIVPERLGMFAEPALPDAPRLYAVPLGAAGHAVRNTMRSAGPRVPELIPSGVRNVCADRAWKHTVGGDHVTGRGVRVALLDTGVNETEDLRGAVVARYSVTGSPIPDPNGHGTMMASLVCARRNGVGYVGVAPECVLYDVQVLDATGRGDAQGLIRGINWAVRKGVDVIVLPLEGRTDEMPAPLKCALLNARDCGVFIVCATGNRPERVAWPGSYEEACVAIGAASRVSGKLEPRLCSGRGEETFAAAPGYMAPGTFFRFQISIPFPPIHVAIELNAHLSGTSVAAAHGAGVAALAIQSNRQELRGLPSRERVARIRKILRDSVSPRTFPLLRPWLPTHQSGWGLLNACRTIPNGWCECHPAANHE